MLPIIPLDKIQERMRFENDWWKTGKIPEDYSLLPHRGYFPLFRDMVMQSDVRRAMILMGPRRVGKTVMLYHLIRELIASGVNPQKIMFITVENPLYNRLTLEQLFEQGRLASGHSEIEDWYVIFDEIQYLVGWEEHLKVLVDDYRQCRFIASGSAAAALKAKSEESGAGRFSDFILPPLTFHEYITMQKLDHLFLPIERSGIPSYTTKYIADVNAHFIDYLNFGGYPEMVFSTTVRNNPSRYIKQDIVDKVLLRDLPSLYGVSNLIELHAFFTALCYQSGQECSFSSLSPQSGVDIQTLKKYLEYLEAAFLIKQIRRIDQSGKHFQRNNFFKVYLTNPSLRTALFAPLTATDDIGAMIETAIFAQWMHRDWVTPYYARWGGGEGEVDMVFMDGLLRVQSALEIKWSDRFFEKPYELKSLIKFAEKNNLKSVYCTTLTQEGIKKQSGIDIEFIPSAVYAYMVGERTLQLKKSKKTLL